MNRLVEEDARAGLRLLTATGQEHDVAAADIVRAYPANQLGFDSSAPRIQELREWIDRKKREWRTS